MVVAGRSRERGEELVAKMRAASPGEGEGGFGHAFVPLDAFSLAGCAEFAEDVAGRAERAGGHGGIDMLVLTQGMVRARAHAPAMQHSSRADAAGTLTLMH